MPTSTVLLTDSSGSATAEPPPSASDVAREHAGFMRAIVRKMGVPRADIDDVVQLVVQELVRFPERIPPRAELGRWLRGVTQHKALNHLQQQARRRRREQAFGARQIEHPAEAASAEEVLIARQTRAIVRETVGELEPKRRGVLVRRAFGGESLKAISAALRLPPGTTSTRLRLAERDLKRSLMRRAATDKRKTGGRSFGFLPLLLLWKDAFARLRNEGGTPVPLPARLRAFALAVAAIFLVCSASRSTSLVRPAVAAPAEARVSYSTATATEVVAPPALSVPAPSRAEAVSERAEGETPKGAKGEKGERGSADGGTRASEGGALGGTKRPASPPGSAESGTRASEGGALRGTKRPASPPGRGNKRAGEGSRRPRDLAAARAWIERARRSAAALQWDSARGALRAYDAMAPDNPFVSERAAAAAVLERGRGGR
jgi:RNA polymerase sigma factor (sigma-70 family)